MQVRLLGPVDVVVDGRPQPVAGRRRAGLLAVLALAAGEVVSADHLTEAVWGGEPPASNSLQSHISGLRAVLGQGAIVGRPPGYMLELGPDGGGPARGAGPVARPGAGRGGRPARPGRPAPALGATPGAGPAGPGRGPAGRRGAPPADRRAGADGRRRTAG